jgi:cellulose synthase/poly-beta-1,6-N-acetylglucosamine synthase-like glycosyltransferase
MVVIETVFLLAIGLVLYTFIGYPLLIAALARCRPLMVPPLSRLPSVSLIVAAHNEEAVIAEKLDNALSLNFPLDRLEIIVASDHSTDRTDHIVSTYAGRGVKLVCLPVRGGKVAAQDRALKHAAGEILIFSDASTLLQADTLQKLVRHFADPMVGCVSCEDRSVSWRGPDAIEDEGLYVRYEMSIRRSESRLGSLVGASGCCFAIRRSLWINMDTSLAEDLMLPLHIREHGFKTVSDPEAVAYVTTVDSQVEEYARRVRTATQGIMTLLEMKRLFNPLSAGLFSLQLISHKLCRFLAPFFLLTALLSNLALTSLHPIYSILLTLQAVFYGAAAAGFAWRTRALLLRALSLPCYLVIVQCAVVHAWVRVARGSRCAVWAPSRRLCRQETPKA